jgi:hypothetical protein
MKRKIVFHQKTTLASGLVHLTDLLIDWPDNLIGNISQESDFVNSRFLWAWTCRELKPVDLGYQTSLASLPSPRHIQYSKKEEIKMDYNQGTLVALCYFTFQGAAVRFGPTTGRP